MLGSMVINVLAEQEGFSVAGTASTDESLALCRQADLPGEWLRLDVERSTSAELSLLLGRFDWAINCIGVIKPYITDTNPQQVERATRVNALFPHELGRAAAQAGRRILQIATDCVYSGAKGDYVESDPHDATDVYGKTKSLGEAKIDGMHHLRCSIIGPELKGHKSLLDWFRGQAQNAKPSGYANHFWNGVTTYHYARMCAGIISANTALPQLQHVIAGAKISKEEMLQCFRSSYNRTDLHIEGRAAPVAIDRTLSTADPACNRRIWQAAGYAEPPTVPQMIDEMARYQPSLRGAG
jgi:dTDP-4-dehydrorhamnose reductase